MATKTNIEIAQEAKCAPIEKVAEKLSLANGDLQLYGKYMAKVPLDVLRRFEGQEDGKLIVMTAITPTPAGEGKTVSTIGLVQGLGRLKLSVMGCLRQPSLGPVFGVKGGATGGGQSQVYPMWDIDLHFTGDIHAVAAAHNLLSAIIENHIQRKNELNIDLQKIYKVEYNIDLGLKILSHYYRETEGDMMSALFLYNNGYKYVNDGFNDKINRTAFYAATGFN